MYVFNARTVKSIKICDGLLYIYIISYKNYSNLLKNDSNSGISYIFMSNKVEKNE